MGKTMTKFNVLNFIAFENSTMGKTYDIKYVVFENNLK
jgi:hypothetical protein